MSPNDMSHGFVYYNWGNIASLVGVAVSIFGVAVTFWTLDEAKSAKVAARQARDAANIRSLTDEVRRGELLVRDLGVHLNAGAFEMAQLRSADLGELLGWIVEYWGEDLAELREHMVSAKNDVDQINRLAQRLTSPEGSTERDIDKASRRVNTVFQEFVKVRASLEKRRSQDGLR